MSVRVQFFPRFMSMMKRRPMKIVSWFGSFVAPLRMINGDVQTEFAAWQVPQDSFSGYLHGGGPNGDWSCAMSGEESKRHLPT
jgi:hypothetical protein